jgi:hypothetical protein
VRVLNEQALIADEGRPFRSCTGHGMKTFCKKVEHVTKYQKGFDMVHLKQRLTVVINKLARVATRGGIISRIHLNYGMAVWRFF